MTMKLHFDPNQNYQLEAIQSVVDLFDGQPLSAGEYAFSLDEGTARSTDARKRSGKQPRSGR
ncbi:MAG: hypothetical protein MUO76_15410 [Anaerolineaceae bacterium]|nr:hypothetical protein [Anaerolineaceae bacterium]